MFRVVSSFCLKFSRDSYTSCSPNVKQTNKLKTTKQKYPEVITLDHQSLRSGVTFEGGRGSRAREGEFTRRILVNAYDANSPIESSRGGTGWGRRRGGVTTAREIDNHSYSLKIRNFKQS